jgi:hypothetical protein
VGGISDQEHPPRLEALGYALSCFKMDPIHDLDWYVWLSECQLDY